MPTTDAANPLFAMRLPPLYLTWLDEMRRKEPDVPTRSEMARRCLERQARAAGVVEAPKKRASRKALAEG